MKIWLLVVEIRSKTCVEIRSSTWVGLNVKRAHCSLKETGLELRL